MHRSSNCFYVTKASSLSPVTAVHCASRRGLAQWHVAGPDMLDLRCMAFIGKGPASEEVVVAGCQQQMYRINFEKGSVTDTIPSPVPFTMMRRSGQYICASAHDGSIHILDPKTLAIVQKWQAYAGTVNDMDARGDYLLTCGWGAAAVWWPRTRALSQSIRLEATQASSAYCLPAGCCLRSDASKALIDLHCALGVGRYQLYRRAKPGCSCNALRSYVRRAGDWT